MPLRHTPTISRLEDVLQRVDERTKQIGDWQDLMNKFRTTTLRKLLEMKEKTWAGEDILERHEFVADESKILEEKLSITVEKFLRRHLPKEGPLPSLAISLSGGVDSMVLAIIITHLRKKLGDYKVFGLHVDYGNRPESKAEADFVEDWCGRHEILFYKRHISEAQRGVTQRDDYEKITREIRFGFYQDMIVEHGLPAMMFGHHHGDLQENVISNIMKGSSLLDMGGMKETGLTNGVLIWRPMLPHPKSIIFDFAHKYGVPYFKDTTPKWSTRGKLRNQLLPLLQDMYGTGYLLNLSLLARESQELRELTEQNLFDPFWRSFHQTPVAVWVDCQPFLQQPVFFWKEALRQVCHSMLGVGKIKEKPIVDQLLPRLRRRAGESKGWRDEFITLNKTNRSLLHGTRLIIFRSELVPLERIFEMGTPVQVGVPTRFGTWTVTIEENRSSPDVAMSEEKADLWALVDGELRYQLPAAPSYCLNPDRRPNSLRAVDKTLTDHVPLVACFGDYDVASDVAPVIVQITGTMWDFARQSALKYKI
eukprot:TRINITY_DN2209_c0_g1_i2.p1 TRINITY_DN2209_c0_g1~~TRINITY_DN2209_c0_g1_i2.p1  ORF type:complete len:536 (+),score=91.10 TRINITY_DN2209_c0_g1_i2:307-1914(+)